MPPGKPITIIGGGWRGPRLLQWMMVSPALQGRLSSMLLRSDWLWRLMFTQTR
jgi:hypothetical protein